MGWGLVHRGPTGAREPPPVPTLTIFQQNRLLGEGEKPGCWVPARSAALGQNEGRGAPSALGVWAEILKTGQWQKRA